MVAGDPRRGQRGDTQRSRQKLVSDLRRRQRIRPQQACPEPPTGIVWDIDAGAIDLADGATIDQLVDQAGGRVLAHNDSFGPKAVYRASKDGRPAIEFTSSDTTRYQYDADSSTDAQAATIVSVAIPTADGFVDGQSERHDFARYFLSQHIGPDRGAGTIAWCEHYDGFSFEQCQIDNQVSVESLVINRASEADRALFTSYNCTEKTCAVPDGHGVIECPVGNVYVRGASSWMRRVIAYDRKLDAGEMTAVREWAQCEFGIDLGACT